MFSPDSLHQNPTLSYLILLTMTSLSEIVDSLALLARDIDSAAVSAELELQAGLTVLVQTTVNRRFTPLKERVHHMQVLVNRLVESTGDSDPNGAQAETNAAQPGNAMVSVIVTLLSMVTTVNS